MSAIFIYEVELLIQGDGANASRLSTRTEYAYSLLEATQQAMFAELADSGAAMSRMSIRRVGPPAEAIRAAAASMERQIADILQMLNKPKKVGAGR